MILLKIIFFTLTLFNCVYCKPNVFELGKLIRNVPNVTEINRLPPYVIDENKKLVSNSIVINLKEIEKSQTMISRHGWDREFVSSQGCVPVTVLSAPKGVISRDTFRVKKPSKSQYAIAIIENAASVSSITNDVLEKIYSENIILASYHDSPLNESNIPTSYPVYILKNLNRPEINGDSSYVGFLFVFNVFESITRSALANLLLVEQNKDFEYCSPGMYRAAKLTHDYDGMLPIYPGSTYPKIINGKAKFYDHFGSHFDTPYHARDSGMSIQQFAVDKLVGPCIKVTAERFGDSAIGVGPFTQWEELANQTIPDGVMILVQTGFHRLWNSPEKYMNNTHYPGFHVSAIEWLERNRKIVGIGIDTLGTDPGTSTTFPCHMALAKYGIFAIENLANLDEFPDASGNIAGSNEILDPVGKCVSVFMRTEKGTGAPLAVFGYVSSKARRESVMNISDGGSPKLEGQIYLCSVLILLIAITQKFTG